MKASEAYQSYLVRLWRHPGEDRAPEPGQASQDWHGEIEHIQSGQRWMFTTLDELLAFWRRQLCEAEAPQKYGAPEKE
jgi:hypothetical protein